MLVLAGDQLLLWEAHGRAQIRRAAGRWTDELKLPLQAVRAIERDGAGFLALGSSSTGVAAVVLFDADAKEVIRWTRTDEPIFAVMVDARGRRAAGRTAFRPLLPDGTWGAPETYPGGFGRVPKIIEHEGRTIVCEGAEITKLVNAPGRCQQLGDGGWRFEGPFLEPPVVCSGWLVARDGPKLEALMVRSLTTGQTMGRRSYRARPAFACAEPDELVIGEHRLESARLPSLAPRWAQPVTGSQVHSVAVLRHFIAYRVVGSTEAVLAPRAK